MSQTIWDAVIIGGGPGGSSAATFLARSGRRVLVLEKERFPRFHIGESLLPYNHQLFREMGVLPTLEEAGLIRKHGAQFVVGNGSKTLKLVFRRGRFTREPMAFQVERSTFDHLLLKHAEKSGAEVRQEFTVSRFCNDGELVSVDGQDSAGNPQTFQAKYLIDASGRGNLTGNQQGLRMIHPRLKKLALFAHFGDVRLNDGEEGGDTIIVRLENKWFWIIPLSPEKTSVGCVMDQAEFASRKQSPEEVFDDLWQSCTVMRDRMRNAKRVNAVQTASDFSYRNRRLIDHRLLRVGDAAGFMDPIFSAGVYLAMYSGKLAANTVNRALASDRNSSALLGRYEKRVSHALRAYWEMVEGFYTVPFVEVFFEPRHRLSLPSAVVALLAGELEGGWKIRWRMRLFFWLIWLQSKRAILPRISFEETAVRKASTTACAHEEEIDAPAVSVDR